MSTERLSANAESMTMDELYKLYLNHHVAKKSPAPYFYFMNEFRRVNEVGVPIIAVGGYFLYLEGVEQVLFMPINAQVLVKS